MDPQHSQQPDLLIGQTIGNYHITQKLGEGGMGAVYLGEHPKIGKKVALKVLHAEFSNNEDVTQRFFHEAKAVNDIGHPNIVDIVDYGVIQTTPQDRLVYFIMEYLSGVTVTQVIRAEAPLAPERAFAIALQVADALSASHKCGIVHRDLKPDNIILIHRGRESSFVKLLDFGIAKLTTDGKSGGRTQTGMVLGTPAYMSPEQCEGRGNVDHRTDIYALGIVLYEMLTGRVPFIGEGYGEILIQHLTQQPIPPSQYRMLNLHVEAVVMKALEKRPENRYPNMDEFMRAIADPVGYVEANGGIQGFAQRPLMPSNAPMPSMRFTPPPSLGGHQQPTPPPGQLRTPIPGTMGHGGNPITGHGVTPNPTTLGGTSTDDDFEPKRSRAGFFIAGGIVVAAAIAGIVIVSSGGSGNKQVAAGSASSSGSSDVGSAGGTLPDPTPGSGSVYSVGSGSAETGSGSAGSAAVGSAGSAGSATTPTDPTPKAEVGRITLRTSPPNAKIIVNGAELAQRTPTPFLLPYSKATVTITLKLDRYEDFTLPLKVTGDHDQEITLKKKRVVSVPGGKGSNAGKGSGKGSNDTGLMRPDDL